MSSEFQFLIKPANSPPLDAGFAPAVLANRHFCQQATASGACVPLLLSLERPDGSVSRYGSVLFASGHPGAAHNMQYTERLLKFLLWQRGGHRVSISAPQDVVDYLKRAYAPNGLRAFDQQFMQDVYKKVFEIISCRPEDMPPEREVSHEIGRYLDGCRIGFDLGASDLKVSAVIDGSAVFSTEIEWQPQLHSDPAYHRGAIRQALQLAASKLPRVDAIGGSSAGIYLNNRPMVASLFHSVPPERMDEIRNMFLEISEEMNAPLEIANDGEVTALAGSMALNDNSLLGIALGSSEAAGFVDPRGRITNWLNELAFAPIDYSPTAPVEDWSGDRGCGAKYFSQQCVFRLAPAAGIEIPSEATNTQKLKFVQERLEAGHKGALHIWQTIGTYLGYAVAHYSDFYPIRHVVILGRCTSGSGGQVILEQAQRVLEVEFPDLSQKILLHLPDEAMRRVGQSIVAASLPRLRK